ncbi:MAG: 2-oxoacid:ferredoxin oxidoreductase subunit gamma [Firmicutes bacterium]|nr:2-oxoacid:ferredoxin oxidoreductase subunit gamma [Bacillota bacterium]
MKHEILLAGSGGQGLLFLGRILAEAALMEDKEVSWFPAYGPEQRGGTSHCSVIVSRRPIGNPVVSEPDILVVMNYPARERFRSMVKPDGILLTNDLFAQHEPVHEEPREVLVPASRMAEELGHPRTANIIMLGALLAHRPVVKRATAEEVLAHVLPSRHEEMLTVNRKALELGYAHRY